VPNTKVVPNIPIFLQENFHNFLRSLSIFPKFFISVLYGKYIGRMEIIFSSWVEFIQLAQSTKQTGPLLFPSLPQLPSGPHASGVSFPQISLPRVRRCATGIPPLQRRSVTCRCCCSAPSPAHVSLHHPVPSRGRASSRPAASARTLPLPSLLSHRGSQE
jgi:hypothetical protein